MADQKVTQLSPITSLDGDEVFYVVVDPSGSPSDRKITSAAVRDFIRPPDEAWTSFELSGRSVFWGLGFNTAVHDPVSERTFIAFNGYHREARVVYYDHATRKMGPVVEVPGDYDEHGWDGVTPITWIDGHGPPSICLDGDGYIHVIWAAHNSPLRGAKSTNPRDPEGGFSTAADLDVPDVTTPVPGPALYTYTSCVWDPVSDAIYAHGRRGGVSDHGDARNSHARLGIVKSDDGGTTWTHVPDAVGAVNIFDASLGEACVYPCMGLQADRGRIWFAFAIAHDGHGNARSNVYAGYYDTATNTVKNAAGTDLGTTVTFAELPQLLAYENWCDLDEGGVGNNATAIQSPTIAIDTDTGYPVIITPERTGVVSDTDPTLNPWGTRIIRWTGAAWASAALPDGDRVWTTGLLNGLGLRYMGDGDWEAFAYVYPRTADLGTPYGMDLVRYVSTDNAATWTYDRILVSAKENEAALGQGIVQVPVNAHDDLPLVWQPEDSGAGAVSDLPVYGIMRNSRAAEGVSSRLWQPRRPRVMAGLSQELFTVTGNNGVADNFNRANTPNGDLGAPDIRFQSWINLRGEWRIFNGRVQDSTGTEAFNHGIVQNTPWADCIVYCDLITGNSGDTLNQQNGMGVLCRANVRETTNVGASGIFVGYFKWSGGEQVQLYVNGTFRVGVNVAWAVATSYRLRIHLNGPVVTVSVDGGQIIQYTIPPADYEGTNITSTLHGLQIYAGNGNAHFPRWDNFEIRQLSDAAVVAGTAPTDWTLFDDAASPIKLYPNVDAVQVHVTSLASSIVENWTTLVQFAPEYKPSPHAGQMDLDPTIGDAQMMIFADQFGQTVTTPFFRVNERREFYYRVPNRGAAGSIVVTLAAMRSHP